MGTPFTDHVPEKAESRLFKKARKDDRVISNLLTGSICLSHREGQTIDSGEVNNRNVRSEPKDRKALKHFVQNFH